MNLKPHSAPRATASAHFEPFVMEALLSVWENRVEVNLSESGVHPLTVGELLELTGGLDELLAVELGYPQTNGIPELRGRIAALYGPDVSEDQVLVTVGCTEALFVVLQTLAEPGAEMVMMLPNYMHAWGTAKNLGWAVEGFHLREDNGWAPDLDELEAKVSAGTKLIAVCNPNNPTGYILSEAEMDRIVAVAERSGAWILADEVYSGAERTGDAETPSFHGRYDKVLALGSLSKAYGLPGLRLGWIVGPAALVDACWRRHEYMTISVTAVATHLAMAALAPEVRPRLLARTREYVRRGYDQLATWIDAQDGRFSCTPPGAAAIAFVRHETDASSTELAERLIHEKSTLVVPGDHFGVGRHLRLSFGGPAEVLASGLERIGELVSEDSPQSTTK